jgi:hypothetical protein
MAARKLPASQRVTQAEDDEFGTLLELPPIAIEGDPDANVLPFSEEEGDVPMEGHNPSRRRRPVVELDPIDIEGDPDADVEPFDLSEWPKGSDEPAFVPGADTRRREDGVSELLPDWAPSWVPRVTGQPVESAGGSTEWEFAPWMAEYLADSEGQMPSSGLGAAATMATNFIPGVAPYRMFTGEEPRAEARTLSPLAAAAGFADAGSMGLGDDIVGLFDDEAGDEYRQGMRDTQRESPGSFGAGETAALATQMLIPGAQLGSGRGVVARGLGAAAEGATYGAIEGAGRSDADDLAGLLADAGQGAAFGGLLSGALGAGGERMAQRAAQPVDEAAIERALDSAALERLGQSGGSQALSSSRMRMLAPGATPREQVASARRTVDRMHQYGAFDGALPPGPEVIQQRVAQQRERALADMDRIAGQMEGETVSPQSLLDHVQSRIDQYDRIPGAEDNAESMRRLLAKFRERSAAGAASDAAGDVPVESDLSMRDLQEWKSYWGDTTDPNARSVPAQDQRGIYRAITGNMQQGVSDVDPVLGADYQRARHDEFIGRGFDEMSGHQTMDAARLRKVSLSDYLTGLQGFQGGGVLGGLASIAANKGLRRNEHGLAAMNLERTARRLRTAPERFGAWAERLNEAQGRGAHAFSAALYVAAQDSAAVREAMADDADERQMRDSGAQEQQEREAFDEFMRTQSEEDAAFQRFLEANPN